MRAYIERTIQAFDEEKLGGRLPRAMYIYDMPRAHEFGQKEQYRLYSMRNYVILDTESGCK